MVRIVGMENSYSRNSRTPSVSGREICRNDTIWYIYIWLTFLEEIKKRTYRGRQMHLPWYPPNRDAVILKVFTIHARLAINADNRTRDHYARANQLESLTSSPITEFMRAFSQSFVSRLSLKI